jgi:hypothetical protein
MRNFTHRSLLVLFFCLLPACTPKMPPMGEVLDLHILPQRVEYYTHQAAGATGLLSAEQQQNLAARFLERHFAPWTEALSVPTDDSNPFWGLKRYQNRQAYAENLLPLPAKWLEEMTRQSAEDLYPSLVQPAVTVVTASLRVLPTHKPVFSNPADPGQGFPFDSMQNSLIPAGTPVLVVHASLDGSWYLVKAPHAFGWVRPWQVAWVDRAFMETFRSEAMLAFIRDDAAVFTAERHFVLSGRVGMLLPRSAQPSPPNRMAALAPLRRADGWAELVNVHIPDHLIKPWPLTATPDNFADVLDPLLGQPYGWGGMFENRDCSALIQDVFALFGIAMPRNSRAQAQAGQVIALDGLSMEQKETRILEQGAPLLTIVNMPGHVMLYLGPDPVSGRPLVLHSMWGLRTKLPGFWDNPVATPGRWVLGRTVITTLTPGAELSNLVRPQGLLAERVSSITLVGQ